jgi:hypothetical protein
MLRRELCCVAAGLRVDQVVNVALSENRQGLGSMTSDLSITHAAEETAQDRRIRMRELNEFETVGPCRIALADLGGRRLVRERTHDDSHWLECSPKIASFLRKGHALLAHMPLYLQYLRVFKLQRGEFVHG